VPFRGRPRQGLVVIDCRTTSGAPVLQGTALLPRFRDRRYGRLCGLLLAFVYDEDVDISLAVKRKPTSRSYSEASAMPQGGTRWPAYQARFRILAFRISKIDGRPRWDLQATPSRSPFGAKRRVENMCRHSTRYDFLSPESHIMRSKFR
jgi:hypothetical protein